MSPVSASPLSRPQRAPVLLENPPNPARTMEAMRALGYDSYSSILDILDNSVDAGSTQIEVSIEERAGDIVISILDNGCGMDRATLSEALRLGSDTVREVGELGKFGMGLVTASIGLSQRVEVLTREDGGELLYGAFDLEEIAKHNKFIKYIQVDPDGWKDRLPTAAGTRVTLSKTDRISNRHPTTFANTLRKRIGQVFRRFLKSGLTVTVNGKSAELSDPLMLTDADTQLVLDTELEVEGGTVSLRVVDLPDFGQAGNKESGIIPQNSGFYILRNHREIAEAETFDFYKKHPDYSHFRAELAFDGTLDALFRTDIKKMTIHPPQAFLDKLRQATQGFIAESGRQGRKRANVARGRVDHSAAEANISRRAPLIPKPPTLVEQRKQATGQGTHTRTGGGRKRTPHVTDLKTVSGFKVLFDEGDYGAEGPFYLVQAGVRTITVTYNREHLFWRELIEHADEPKVIAILDYLIFALANSELLVPEQASIVKANVNSTLVGLLV